MRFLLLILIVLLTSCHLLSKPEQIHDTLTGHWLVLYPDHQLKNDRQKFLYSSMQDSIVGLSGLKLISLDENGTFHQADSTSHTGKWGITAENVLFIQNGGKGFNYFTATISGYDDGILKLTEQVPADDEKIKLVWHLRKLKSKSALRLVSQKSNTWRHKPAAPENQAQICQRLASMLEYYSAYYELVTSESSFFVPTRVVLPFRFYQHAIGVMEYSENSFFASLFYDDAQARTAHKLLSQKVKSLRDDFPTRDNYVKEYAAFMHLLAEAIATNGQ